MSQELTPTPAESAAPSPIADLSYRNYDGPLKKRTLRWWVVALASLRQIPKLKFFWACVTLSAMPYFFIGIALYSRSVTKGFSGGMDPTGMMDEPFVTSFFQALRMQSFFLFLLALLVGAGSVASDMRSNALQVYLSKPITKSDYLIGKWAGIFVPVYVVALIPALALYLFCLLSFTDDGFLKQDPWLIMQIFAVAAVPAAIHASLLIGFSGWSKTPFMAGATYAAFFMLSQIVSGMVWAFRYGIPSHGDITKGALVRSLSLNGIIQGLAQNIYRVTLHNMIFMRGGMNSIEMKPPTFWILLLAALVLIALGWTAARMKVRAVEVIRG